MYVSSTEVQITSQNRYFKDIAPVSKILSGQANSATKLICWKRLNKTSIFGPS